MARKSVRVHYRRYLRGSEPAIRDSLSASIASALQHIVEGRRVVDAFGRRTCVDPNYGTLLLNGVFPAPSGDVFGEFVRFDPSANIPLLFQNSDSDNELEIREMSKPNDAEFLAGMSFFMIRGDHVLVVEQDFTNPMMERYLRWLLCEQCPIAERDTRLPLVPKLSMRDQPDRLSNVSKVEVKPAPMQAPGFDFEEDTLHSETRSASTDIMRVLRAANIDTPRIETLMREHGASVQLNMEITLKVGRKRLKLDGDEALAVVRNVPDEDLILRGDGVQRNRGVLERVSDQVDIERKGNTLDRKHAWQMLQEKANHYRDMGLIE